MPERQIGLRSPIHLPEVKTPDSTSSIASTNLTPAPSATDVLTRSFSKLSMSSPSMPNLSGRPPRDRPPADLHSKLQDETPRRSKTNTMNSIVRAFSSSNLLNQVLGLRDPESLVVPPWVPHDLVKRFEAGLQQYDCLFAAGVFASNKANSNQITRPPQKSKTEMADILEEKESPIHTKPAARTIPRAGSNLKINVPQWTSDKQAVAVAQRYSSVESYRGVAETIEDEHVDCELAAENNVSWRYGSSTTLASSSASGNEVSSVPAPLFPPRTTSLLPPALSHVNSSSPAVQHGYKIRALPSGLLPRPPNHTASMTVKPSNKQLNQNAYNSSSALGKAESLPLLVPSSEVEQQYSGFLPAPCGRMAGDVDSKLVPTYNTYKQATQSPHTYPTSSPVPHIAVQAPSPKKLPARRKRAPSLSTDEHSGLPLTQRPRMDDTAGLPILPLYAEGIWKFDFPGNTQALLTILLTWSQTMWTFHRRLSDPKLFAIHPAFPYAVDPPLTRKLVSVSFYDTNFEPHKEIRFLGPGNAAEMSYHEVDTFNNPLIRPDDPTTVRPSTSIDAFKQTLGLTGSEGPKHIRYMDMPQRAKTGEGRWCYILIKGHKMSDRGTAPHVILAWHISAVTGTSDCLHTIYSDEAAPKPKAQPQRKLKRFSSLQNLGAALKKPYLNLNHTLRSANSSSELQPVDAKTELVQGNGLTLHRTVLKLERAGGIPLIEGFRVDVGAFRGWLDACGKGEGKVIMWRERDGG